ncbi:MAG: hypothetical protein WAZ34_03745 [Rhodocyclaceae bacterium]
MSERKHNWRFFRAGGFDQVRLDSAAELLALGELDQKLWVALSCPTSGLEFDARTLALLDADGDGHIRAPELIAALQWTSSLLKDPELLASGTHPLPLSAIDEGCAEGRQLLASAREILKNLGRADADAIGADETTDSARIFARTRFNGDGIITAASTDDADLQQLIGEIGECFGSSMDRSGEAGITQESSDRFFSDAATLVEWRTRPERDPGLLPAGASSEAAGQVLAAVREKIDDYFTRGALVAVDPRAGSALNGSEADYLALAGKNLAAGNENVAALPIARIEADRPLPLATGLNPAWAAAVAALRSEVVQPLLGEKSTLSTAEWADLCARFAAFADWQSAFVETPLARLDPAHLRATLECDAQARINALLAADLALEGEANAIAAVERLVHYVRDLSTLANNFVSFRDFYTRRDKAIFQCGTLYLDGRSCDLCVPVLDPAKHAALASLAGVYLAYLDCVRGGEKRTIAAAFTAGDADQLMVGRNGVFYDRKGQDWDATISKIVDHPISIRQAFWSPYKKVSRMIGEQLQKFAAAKAKSVEENAVATLAGAQKKAEAAKPGTPAAGPAPFDVAKFAGIFAAIGLAVGALGTALAAIVTGFIGLRWWQMPLALGGLMLMVSGPSMAMAWFKLRNRNLGPLLDANGWAVNARARINIPFGSSLTQVARLPDGAERSLTDPYADRKKPWGFYGFLLVLAIVLLIWVARSAGQ